MLPVFGGLLIHISCIIISVIQSEYLYLFLVPIKLNAMAQELRRNSEENSIKQSRHNMTLKCDLR